MANTAENAIYTRLSEAPTFHPASTDLFASDWSLETGDVVTVQSGNESYSVPVYSMDLVWKGDSKVSIQSTGNEKRQPLPELRRRQYGASSGMYKHIDESMSGIISAVEGEVYESVIAQTDTAIQTAVRTKSKVYRQWGDPSLDASNVLNDGDIWIKDSDLRTWADAKQNTWNNSQAYLWDDYYGNEQFVWKNGAWKRMDSWKDSVNNNIVMRQTKDEIEILGRKNDALEAHISITAERLETKYTDKVNGLSSSITQTASQIRSEVSDSINNVNSSITQTANQIRSEVVSKDGVISAINQTAETITIQASKIQLDGNTSLAGRFTISNGRLVVQSGMSVNGNVYAYGDIYLPQRNGVIFGQATISESNAGNIITGLSISLSNNTYTLSKTTVGNSSPQTIGTFSRATSLSGSWSGNTYTVTASPQGNTISTTITRPTASNISLGSFQYVTSQGASSMPSATTLTTLKSLMTSNVQGFVYFKATLSGGSGEKWYRVATIN